MLRKLRTQLGKNERSAEIFAFVLLFILKFAAGSIFALPSLHALGCLDLVYAVRAFLRTIPYRAKKRNLRPLLHFAAAFLLFEIGFSMLTSALTAIFRPQETGNGFFPFLAIVVLFALERYLLTMLAQRGEKSGNRALASLGKTMTVDTVLYAITAAAYLIHWITGLRTDAYAAFPAAAVIIIHAFLIAIVMILEMITEAPDPELVGRIRRTVRECSGIFGTGRMRMRFFGEGRRLLSMNVYTPSAETAQAAKERLDTIAEMIGRDSGVQLRLYPLPIDGSDEKGIAALQMLTEALEAEDWRACADHFHYVRGENFDNLIFDLCLPEDYDEERGRQLCGRLENRIRGQKPRYIPVPTVKIIRQGTGNWLQGSSQDDRPL